MAKKNNNYWQERFDQIEQAQNNKSVKYTKKLEKKYSVAASEIDAQINKWYNRIARNNNISMTEARRLLSASELKEFKWTVEEYIARGRENAVNQQWMKELENASAKFHINRLEAMKLEVRHQVEMAMASGQQDMFDMLGDVYKDTFYRSCYELQKGVGVGFDVAKLDDNTVQNLLNKPWAADGTNFSQKLWGNKTKLINTLDQELTRMVLLGETPKRAIQNVKDAMNSSLFSAKRLVLTEQAYFTSEAQKKTFSELDVERFEVLSSMDMKVCPICAAKDKSVHPMKEFHIGITAPPFHPFCRCVTAPFFDDEFSAGTRIATGADGETYYIPNDTTYGEWMKTFVDNGSKESLEKFAKSSIIKAGSSTIAFAQKIVSPEQRAKIINEAINAEKPIYAEDLRYAYSNYGVKPKEEYYDVVLHGAPNFTEYEHEYSLDNETLYYIISGRRDYQGENIRLLSCSTGKADKNGDCVAQYLADKLNVDVYAPIDTLNFEIDGRLTIGRKRISEEEGFKLFTPRR